MLSTSAAVSAFRETYVNAGALPPTEFNEWAARQQRYDIFWAYFQNSAYRDINKWAQKYRADFGMYKFPRNIYNPAQRLATFRQAHIMAGNLDPLAGDGKIIPSALPIVVDAPQENNLRAALSELWDDSNWQTRKDIYTLQGTVFGDIGLRVVDDTLREKVYLSIVHPGTLKTVQLDPFGNVKAYEIQEQRRNPNGENPKFVTYTEIATRDGDNVVYRTFLNGQLYAWNKDTDGNSFSEWAIPYGFIPLVVVQNNNVGLDWGWSAFHATRPKIQEIDDLASISHDQMRKMYNAPWLMAGVTAPKDGSTPTATNANRTAGDPDKGREEAPIFYGPAGATATALVAPLDIAALGLELDRMITDIEQDHPELRVLKLMISGEVSGRALAIARDPAKDEIIKVRANYDDGLRRAQQMAISIGGYRAYPGYESFSLESYANGALDHYIDGARRVFDDTLLDKYEERTAFYGVFKAAADAGAPIPRQQIWTEAGYSEEEIAQMQVDLQAQMQSNMSAVLTDIVSGTERTEEP